MPPITTSAVLLRTYDYSETSRIYRFYTERHGLLGVMAKGIRGRSAKGSASLATFVTGHLTVYVKPERDLHTMKDFEVVNGRGRMGTHMLRFGGASAVGEVVSAHTDREPNSELFETLERTLDRLESAPPDVLAAVSLSSLWQVVGALGFSPELGVCVLCGTALDHEEVGRFDFPAGGMRCAACAADGAGPRIGPQARRTLGGLVDGRDDGPVTFARRHLSILSDFIAYHVASRPLKSLQFLGDLLPPDEVEPS